MATGFFQDITKAVQDLKTAATTGFTIDDQAGKDLQAAITRLKSVIRESTNELTRFPHEPIPLGSSPAANVYKTFIPTIATDPTQGAITAFEQMLHDLDDAYETIARSMATYQQTEQGNAGGIDSAGGVPR